MQAMKYLQYKDSLKNSELFLMLCFAVLMLLLQNILCVSLDIYLLQINKFRTRADFE